VPQYDFATHCRVAAPESAWWQPQPIVLVDGLWLLSLPRIRTLFDLKIFLDVPAELRCQRRLARDIVERGYTAEAIRRQLQATVLPMHDRHVEPQRQWADAVVTYPILEHTVAALVERINDGRTTELVAATAS
jgi:uridine kinase